ncbi:hypothetical protein CAEBREN_31610 [Caenorhabditis brenneri]|uniref:G-protein coupled receptors family 1 profile domain-containing protein n=1 Tax=Caenorhabditis brenneri TaxID=135651 RepID=G0NKM7_CAEBE|nr:hypothetical protein CAEBREN_31610 [Caenorhabditis brenneri]
MEILLVILLIIYSTIFVVGFTGNLVMVLVTFHSKNLRSICNMLICACCFCDLLLFTDIVAFFISMFIPISQELCFYINIPADFGAFASNVCVLMVGIDRLIAVRFPTKYKALELKRFKYFGFLMTFPIVYALFLLDSSMKAVFKSLSVTVCLVVCGWMTTDLIGALSVTIPMDQRVANMIQLYCGTFIFTSSAFNALVYYKMSRDYRYAMRAMLGIGNETHALKSTTYREGATDGKKSTANHQSTNTNAINTDFNV